MPRPLAGNESFHGHHHRRLLGGFSATKAAEYSFLLGLITLSAASAYKVFTDGAALSQTLALKPMLLGCAVAFFPQFMPFAFSSAA